jgi:hypothetical protein
MRTGPVGPVRQSVSWQLTPVQSYAREDDVRFVAETARVWFGASWGSRADRSFRSRSERVGHLDHITQRHPLRNLIELGENVITRCHQDGPGRTSDAGEARRSSACGGRAGGSQGPRPELISRARWSACRPAQVCFNMTTPVVLLTEGGGASFLRFRAYEVDHCWHSCRTSGWMAVSWPSAPWE